MNRSVSTSRRPRVGASLPSLVLISTLVLTVAAAYYVDRTAEAKDRLRFDNAVLRTEDDIRDRLETYTAMLRAATGLFAADERIGRDRFRAFVERLELARRYPGIQGLGYSVRLAPAAREGLVARMRREGVPDFRLTPEGERDEYTAIIYLEPLDERNRAALGYDMFSEPVRRAAMESARDTGAPAMSGRVTLVQEIDPSERQAGFLIYAPVYRGGTPPASVETRRAALLGYVYSPFRADDLLAGIFGTEPHPLLDFQLYDGDTPADASLMHRSDLARGAAPQASARPRFTSTLRMEVAGRTWTLVFFSRPEVGLASGRWLAPYLLLGGLACGLVLFFVTRSRVRARRTAERTARSLAQSETRFRTMVEQSPLSTQIFSPDGRTVRVNRAWEKLWGVTLEQLGDYNILADPQLKEKGITPYIERAFGGEATSIPPILYDPNETIPGITVNPEPVRWVQAFIYPVKDEAGRVREVVLIHEDITERKRAEEAVRFQAHLLNTVEQAVIATDLRGRVTYWSRYAERLYGWTGAEAIGRHIIELTPADELRARAAEIMARLGAGESWSGEFTVRRRDGTTFPALVTDTPIYDEAGRLIGIVGVSVDHTERKRLEEQLRARADELVEANRLKDEFLATLSHELRTPLTAILGWAKLIRTESLPAETVRRGLETIERNAEAQTQLIEDLLDVSRIITGKLRLRVSTVELEPVIESAVESVRLAAEARGVQLSVELDPAAGPVSGDPDRLRQVAWNLLTNAIKFTPAGGRVEVRLVRRGASDELSVTDTGAGIAPEFLPYVFDRFRQANGAITREHGGLGLGLSIVRHLVELHGGTIRAASEGPGRGSTFTINLPVAGARVAPDNHFVA